MSKSKSTTTEAADECKIKKDKLGAALEDLKAALAEDSCAKCEKGVAVCAAGDKLREVCGGSDTGEACGCLDTCEHTPLMAKAIIVGILHALPEHWHNPSVETKYALIEKCDAAIKALA